MKIEEQFVLERTEDMPEIEEACNLIKEYKETDFYESKNKLLNQWEIDDKSIHSIVISVFTLALTKPYLTFQTIVGLLNHKISLENEIDRVKIIADIVGLISQTGLIDIESSRGKNHIITTEYEFEEELPVEEKHVTLLSKPDKITSNWDEEYRTGSLLLGHKMNHHEGDLRLSHLNRINTFEYKLNKKFIEEYEEEPKYEIEDSRELAQWEQFKIESEHRYNNLEQDEMFYITNKYDYRGRCYSRSYYLNPQGTSYKKAIIQLAQTEIVIGD